MARLFHWMAAHPVIFMVIWPAICISLIVFGWTRPGDPIEDQVAAQWVPTRGQFARDTEYARSVSNNIQRSTTLAAMAIARDGENLYTEKRLNEIRARMNETERVVVDYKNISWTWEDVCLTNGGYPYELPCARLTSMDYFQEARWFFDSNNELYRRTWYRELIQKLLLKPRLPRFGVLMDTCKDTCGDLIDFRTETDPFLLLADVGGLDFGDDCRICIEDGYEDTISGLSKSIPELFTSLADKLGASNLTDATPIIEKLRKIVENLSSVDAQEFFYYYTARNAYGSFGAGALLNIYAQPALKQFLSFCADNVGLVGLLGLQCPPLEFSAEEAVQTMFRHADAEFSSITTAGAPLPFWGSADGTGALLEGDSPVGGSGIDMSGDMGSLAVYISEQGTVNLTSMEWTTQVEKNPMFAWFMGGEELAPVGTKCGNGVLPGTNILGNEAIGPLLDLFGSRELDNPFDEGSTITVKDFDNITAAVVEDYSFKWCTPYNLPNEQDPEEAKQYSRQHFARMWYDLLINSDELLGITEGVDDPYTWSIGVGCGYSLRGERGFYTGQNDSTILKTASRDLYYVDEGTVLGVVSPELLVGGATPAVDEYSYTNPLQSAAVLQTLYPAIPSSLIADRVQHCKRPGGGPQNITVEDAEEILFRWKEAAEAAWNKGWDDEGDGDVQFVSFADDAGGVVGSTGRMLREITLSNTGLTIISIVLISIFSVAFMYNSDLVESRVLVTLVGVTLVVLSFFAAVALGLAIGIKIQVTIAWTLPFIILGLGVDDMYIVLQSLKEQDGYTKSDYLKAMNEVIVPVSMTSIVNASMFAILNVSDIPAVYTSARVALFSIIALYCAIIFCFPAYCYVDMRRQAVGKKDFLPCSSPTTDDISPTPKKQDFRSLILYDKFYKPIILGEKHTRWMTHTIVWVIAVGMVAAGAYGITISRVGVGLEEFFPASNPAFVWATRRTEDLAAWTIGMQWGALNYSDPETQMKVIKQFEHVVDSRKVASLDTDKLWIGNFLLWSSNLCESNFDRSEFDKKACGHDMVFSGGRTCSATWTQNTQDLRDRFVPDYRDSTCVNHYGGICRKGSQLPAEDVLKLAEFDPSKSYCPTINGWSDEQWVYCLVEWRKVTGFEAGFAYEDGARTPKECSGEYEHDQAIAWPLPISQSPTLYAFDMQTHEDTLDLVQETRSFCDDSELHCWMTGIPFSYWGQYENIYQALFTSGGLAILVGSVISFFFLFFTLQSERHSTRKVLFGALIGALLILAPMILSFVAVVGLSSLVGVNVTGFSNMSYVLSVGFSVEFAVHVVSRWLLTDQSIKSSIDRVRHTMSFLMLPTFMSFVSSVIGVCCLAFTAFSFNEKFFFRPLIIVMFVTYFYGCWWLPTFLCIIETDVVRLGKVRKEDDSASAKEQEAAFATNTSDDTAASPELQRKRTDELVEYEFPSFSKRSVLPVAVSDDFTPQRFEL